jgi:hypothetical protein
MAARCDTCQKWSKHGTTTQGDCRANPPVAEGEVASKERDPFRGRWPVTNAGEWCAQYVQGSQLGA